MRELFERRREGKSPPTVHHLGTLAGMPTQRDQITATLASDRNMFMGDGEALLLQVERIKAGLESALARGTIYRGARPFESVTR